MRPGSEFMVANAVGMVAQHTPFTIQSHGLIVQQIVCSAPTRPPAWYLRQHRSLSHRPRSTSTPPSRACPTDPRSALPESFHATYPTTRATRRMHASPYFTQSRKRRRLSLLRRILMATVSSNPHPSTSLPPTANPLPHHLHQWYFLIGRSTPPSTSQRWVKLANMSVSFP